MVSRRKILSRSRDDLNLDQTFIQPEEEDDVWYNKDKLYKEHIQEVLDKWTQIDDEIWAKVIVFERNRRVAKAYARAPVLTINGSDDGFDGMRIGLCGFDNPMRDQKTEELKRHVGQGVKIKMDDAGNILIRRYSKSNVYVKSTASSPNEETAIGADILKLPNQAIESEKIVKLFDMKKFQSNVNRELRRAYPDRRRLETQCLSAVAFVKSENDILDCPVWILIINVVAMDMLKSKLPPVQRPVDIKNRPRIPIPDEDPYSIAGNSAGSSGGSSGMGGGGVGVIGGGVISNNMINNGGISNGGPPIAGHVAAAREQLLYQTQQLAQRRSEKPPKLPPRDNVYPHDIPKPDYDDIEAENRLKAFARGGKSDKGKDNKKYDDPYYCGLRARVPNFAKSPKPGKEKDITGLATSSSSTTSTTNGSNSISIKKTSVSSHMPLINSIHHHQVHSGPIQHQHHMVHGNGHHHPYHNLHHQQQQQMMWHARSYESGIDQEIYDKIRSSEDAYSLHQQKIERHLRSLMKKDQDQIHSKLINKNKNTSNNYSNTDNNNSNYSSNLNSSRLRSSSSPSIEQRHQLYSSDKLYYQKHQSSNDKYRQKDKSHSQQHDASQEIYFTKAAALHSPPLSLSPTPIYQEQPQNRGRKLQRNGQNSDYYYKRDRSLYDYRSDKSIYYQKLESDMESIYGYLKPRKPRNHGLKSIPK